MKKGVRIQVMIQEAGGFPAEYNESRRSVDGPNVSVNGKEGKSSQGWVVSLELLGGYEK
jgi:hypothetical protein